jgi:site-specific recombinase XerD
MLKKIEKSFAYHLLEERITKYEEKFIEDDIDGEEVTKKRIEMLYDYYCWNLKSISTKKFYSNIKKFEKFIYSTGLIMEKEKITQKTGGKGSGLPNPVFASARV